MNNRQLRKIGVPEECINDALQVVQQIVSHNRSTEKENRFNIKEVLQNVVDNPEYVPHSEISDILQTFSASLVAERDFIRPEPIDYKTWGEENIDEGSHEQMKQACSMPNARGAALMPDAHVGYGLPIGGVLGLENAICPFAVGVDIACRMKLSVLDIPVSTIDDKRSQYEDSLMRGARFGVGIGEHAAFQTPQDHPVMDEDWNITKVTRQQKDKARKQLGSSGSGNHFVEFGVLSVDDPSNEFGLDPGKYVALMSHSGSRGPGAAVCSTYSGIAQSQLPKRYSDLGRLAWLDLDTEEGQEYWEAMNLMGRFAAANHAVIHRNVSKLLGARIIGGVENHHNFAWKEQHGGKELIVHRKGATPAGKGVLGVIPGSMADPAFVVRGRGNPDSLNSASHGAGRIMSRKKAKDKFSWNATKQNLAKRGITVLAAGADEVPGVYKNIEEVMAQQSDLVDVVARFDPKVVRMCGDGSRAED